MADRYFLSTPITGQRTTLAAEEAHHLVHVLRARPGTEVVLFDDSGAEFVARVEQVGRSTVDLTIIERREINREGPRKVVVGVALPKGDRQKWLVEKLVELGVASIVPLVTERGVAQPTESSLARLERSVIEASKQCGRNQLLRILSPQTATEFFASVNTGRRLIAHPSNSATPETIASNPSETGVPRIALTDTAAITMAVGPEGGFTSDEVAAALRSGWEQIDLGPRILRVETAAVALAAAIQLGVL